MNQKDTQKEQAAGDETKDQKAESQSVEQKPKEAQQQAEKLQQEITDMTDKLQRLAADYANYQKRVPRQIADSVEYEKRSIIKSLLPSMDNFALALSGAQTAQGPEALQSIIKGIQFIYDHFFDALKAHGVERIVSVGQPFEPGKHEAITQKTDPDKPDNTVLEEFQAGYMINNMVLRPSKVAVNKLPQPKIAQANESETTDNQKKE